MKSILQVTSMELLICSIINYKWQCKVKNTKIAYLQTLFPFPMVIHSSILLLYKDLIFCIIQDILYIHIHWVNGIQINRYFFLYKLIIIYINILIVIWFWDIFLLTSQNTIRTTQGWVSQKQRLRQQFKNSLLKNFWKE
jgi:hypothetical protein